MGRLVKTAEAATQIERRCSVSFGDALDLFCCLRLGFYCVSGEEAKNILTHCTLCCRASDEADDEAASSHPTTTTNELE